MSAEMESTGQGRRWLAASAVAAGVLSMAGTVVIAGVAVSGARRILPDERAGLWIASWLLPAGAAVVGLSLLAILLGRAARRGGRIGVYGLVLAVCLAYLLPLVTRKHEAALKTQCLGNVKSIAIAVSMYADDYGAFPAAGRWSDDLRGYLKDPHVYCCPDATGRCAYAYNAALGGRRADELGNPESVVAIFESDRGWDAHGGPEAMTDFARHLGGENVGFPDGHVRWYARQKPVGEIRWDTKWPHAFREGEAKWVPVWGEGPRSHGSR